MLEHTADAGIIARGGTLSELFANAALGMFSLMADLGGVREREQRQIELTARDVQGLLVNWLSELLFYVDAEEILFSRFEIDELSDTRLRARAWGERIDRDRHELHFGIKAVTRHMLEVVEENGDYRATVLFDI